jgi:hypothetical protein
MGRSVCLNHPCGWRQNMRTLWRQHHEGARIWLTVSPVSCKPAPSNPTLNSTDVSQHSERHIGSCLTCGHYMYPYTGLPVVYCCLERGPALQPNELNCRHRWCWPPSSAPAGAGRRRTKYSRFLPWL